MTNGQNISEIHNLSPRVKIVWYLGKVIFVVPVLIVIGISSFFVKIDTIPFIALIALALAIPYIPVELEYRDFTYTMREKDLLIRKGVIDRKDFAVPYEKIQNVTVERSAFDRMLGTGTLHIETAGAAMKESDIVLPGIYHFHDLVNLLITKSKSVQTAGVEKHEKSHDDMIELLHEIHEDLKTIKAQEPVKPVMSEILSHSKGREAKHEIEHVTMIETLKQIREQLHEIHAVLKEDEKPKKKKRN